MTRQQQQPWYFCVRIWRFGFVALSKHPWWEGGGEILELCFYGWKGWVNEKHVNFSYKHLVIIVIYNKYTFHIHKKVSLFKPWILEIFVCFPEKQQFRRRCKI